MPISMQSAIRVQKRVQGDPGVEQKQMCSSAMFKGTSWCLTRCWNCGPKHSNSKTSRLQQTSHSNSNRELWCILLEKVSLSFSQSWPNFSSVPLSPWTCLNNKVSGEQGLGLQETEILHELVGRRAHLCNPCLSSHVCLRGWGWDRSLCALAWNCELSPTSRKEPHKGYGDSVSTATICSLQWN